jgi:hypothetical protein
MEPREHFPGCLGILLRTKDFPKYLDLESQKTPKRYIVRALLSDHIPLTGEIADLVSKTSDALVWVNGNPLTINLEFPHYLPVFYDLVPAPDGKLSHVQVEVEANHPVRALAPARTAVNQLLDTLMRVGWVPLVVMRVDVYLEDESEPLLHQILLPFTRGLNIGPLGGFGSFPRFAPYEALLREAVVATSPYYRFLCAFKLFEGVDTLRYEIRKLVERFSITAPLPRPPTIDQGILRNLDFKEEFVREIKTAKDLLNKFRTARHAIAHFLVTEAADHPLHISNGDDYRFYAMAGAALLHYSNLAVSELMIYFRQQVYSHVARGTILIMPEDRARCVIKAERFWRTQREHQETDEEGEEMARPMFIQINSGRKVEFINTAHIRRIEVIHPGDGEAGSGTLVLEDGSERTLGENEINWVMRMMPDLLGSPALGTQDTSPGYWRGKQRVSATGESGHTDSQE